MATLLELSTQGDVGTISDESKLSQVKLMNPQQLYELWERQPWSAHAIDLEQDKADWAERVTDYEKHQLAYNLSAFFIGEERVATPPVGLGVDAAGGQVDQRLIEHPQLPARDGGLQVTAERGVVGPPVEHAGPEQHDVVGAGPLGLVHGDVGPVAQIVGVLMGTQIATGALPVAPRPQARAVR